MPLSTTDPAPPAIRGVCRKQTDDALSHRNGRAHVRMVNQRETTRDSAPGAPACQRRDRRRYYVFVGAA